MSYQTAEEMLQAAALSGKRLGEVVLEKESAESERPREELLAQMAENLRVMREAMARGLVEPIRSRSGLMTGLAYRLNQAGGSGTLLGGVLSRAAAGAVAVAEINASMGRIVAAPTAGSCGVLPGALLAVAEARGLEDAILLDALFAGAGIGQVVASQATLAGAAAGCQAEIGVASAMAAGAVAEALGGAPEAVFDAAAMALQNLLGLVCDPVGGLVEVPCIQRNATGAVNALAASEMALAGIRNLIPFDEVVAVMLSIGRMMPCQLRETAEGGLAVTPTGLRIKAEMEREAKEHAPSQE